MMQRIVFICCLIMVSCVSVAFSPAKLVGNVPPKKIVNQKISSKNQNKIFKHEEVLNLFFELSAQVKTKTARQHAKPGVQMIDKNKPPLFVIVLDPGHGGRDFGASGKGGVKEKNVVLAIAKRLASMINQTKNMRAILTRTGDYYLPLRERLRISRKNNADLFIAIHADAYFDQNATGASVYALSQRGATSEAARWLAKVENYSELDGVDLEALTDKSPMLRSVLIDLVQTSTIQDSIRLGNKMLDALDDISSLHYKKVEQAPFVVLKSPDIPSILIETGFMTNPQEEKRLANPLYQDRMAKALCQGLNKYVAKYGDLMVENSRVLSSPVFPSIVRHQLIVATLYDTTNSNIDPFIS